MPLSDPLFLPDPMCCAPPHSVLNANALEPIRPYLCPKCLSAFDRHYGLTRNSFEKEDAMSELVLNESTQSHNGDPLINRAGEPLPEMALNFSRGQDGKTITTIASKIDNDTSCRCPSGPLPETALFPTANSQPVAKAGPLDFPTLVFRKGMEGQTISEIV